MSEQHVKELEAAFERVAFEACEDGNLPCAVMAQMSAAISLKRIADSLGSFDLASFENQLLDIAYKSGLNFRGQA